MFGVTDDKIKLWIDGYSNCGAKTRTKPLNDALLRFQELYPERDYVLARSRGMWFIVRREDVK